MKWMANENENENEKWKEKVMNQIYNVTRSNDALQLIQKVTSINRSALAVAKSVFFFTYIQTIH